MDATRTRSDARQEVRVTRSGFLALVLSLLFALCMALPHAGALAEEAQGGAAGADVAAGQEQPATLKAYFLDVGQGDSEFVMLPDGKTMLIDAGEQEYGASVISFVQDTLGLDRIDYLVVTHPHADHIGGLPAVLYSPIYIDQVVAPEVSNDTETFEAFLDAVDATGKQITPAEAGLVLDEADGLRVEVLSPAAGDAPDDANDASAVIKVTWGTTSFLFTGDASYKVVSGANPGHVDVLKVGHHGSNTATSVPLLEKLTPSVAVIEVGWGNSYGHPTTETLDELASCGVQTWRTDMDGTVEVDSDGTTVAAHALATGATEPAGPDAAAARTQADAEAQAQAAAQEQAQAEAAAQAPAAQEQPAGQGADATETVYVTKTGKKYHHAGCQYLKKSQIPISLEEAVAQGYTPCSKCC